MMLMKRLCILAIIGMCATLACLHFGKLVKPAKAQDQNAPNPVLATILDGMHDNLSRVKTAQGTFTVNRWFTEGIQPAAKPESGEFVYTWAISGQKFREACARRENDGSLTDTTDVAYNGLNGRFWALGLKGTSHNAIVDSIEHSIVDSTISGWLYLSDRYSPKQQSIEERIAGLSPCLKGEEDIEGIHCYRVDGADAYGDHYTWWISPDKGFLPVKEERSSSKSCTTTTILNSQSSDDGAWLPTKIVISCEKTNDGSQPVKIWEVTTTANDLKINQAIDSDLFDKVRGKDKGTEFTEFKPADQSAPK